MWAAAASALSLRLPFQGRQIHEEALRRHLYALSRGTPTSGSVFELATAHMARWRTCVCECARRRVTAEEFCRSQTVLAQGGRKRARPGSAPSCTRAGPSRGWQDVAADALATLPDNFCEKQLRGLLRALRPRGSVTTEEHVLFWWTNYQSASQRYNAQPSAALAAAALRALHFPSNQSLLSRALNSSDGADIH